ncbi:Hydroxyethylthiazole kinase family-domain-containing protein [Phakopsora pachyrhizi]|uniref:Hydroxyethylthiazole kinase family-domain-containing protein n=1 Tax=Phakopsora pachyrhizi TaxID=170000 RepID=A0AAV0BJA4_PHAPC|nr:Hydroxyethylthiazole kinase family-domain-containing protein [Phakopsora pachyrhizi]
MMCQDDIQVTASGSASTSASIPESIEIKKPNSTTEVEQQQLPNLTESQLTPLKRSWVWTHFVKNSDGRTVTCNAIKPDGLTCEVLDSKEHLLQFHLEPTDCSNPDLSLYLVTSSERLSPDLNFLDVVRSAIEGGVTVVQLREKMLSTHECLERALCLRKLCQHPVKLIINDHVDIAMACCADGVHLGQDDMPIEIARKLLGPKAIIGITVNTIEEAVRAAEKGANYLGIGTCWPTDSKEVTDRKLLGPRGIKAIRDELLRLGHRILIVAIGGINKSNLARTLYGCVPDHVHVNKVVNPVVGVAVISAIMSSPTPKQAAGELRQIISSFAESLSTVQELPSSQTFMNDLIIHAYEKHRRTDSPRLIHHITNTVVQNDCANLTLALGCSPLMSSNIGELDELLEAQRGCLVFNIGTIDDNQVEAMKFAGQRANLLGKPIVFDPVGVSASQLRKRAANELLNCVQMSVIKGNQSEIATLAQVQNDLQACGVDSKGSLTDPGKVVKSLARRERCVVAMTGEVDWVSDGTNVIKLDNGIQMLSCITGSGCMIGSAIGSFVSSIPQANRLTTRKGLPTLVDHELLIATLVGISSLNVSAEIFQEKTIINNGIPGPNTLKTGLIDEIYHLTTPKLLNKIKIMKITD